MILMIRKGVAVMTTKILMTEEVVSEISRILGVDISKEQKAVITLEHGEPVRLQREGLIKHLVVMRDDGRG